MEAISTGIIILAAGNSSRLGKPKQLLQYNGKSLIQRAYDAAHEIANQQVIVVTGSYHPEILDELAHYPVHFAYNADWEAGMGSSIKVGLGKLIELYPAVNQVILSVSDQPFVSADLFSQLIKGAESANAGIVASAYGDTLGTPVLFHEKYFPAIFSLDDAHGAKKLLNQFEPDIISVAFSRGEIDIDTEKDYQDLFDK